MINGLSFNSYQYCPAASHQPNADKKGLSDWEAARILIGREVFSQKCIKTWYIAVLTDSINTNKSNPVIGGYTYTMEDALFAQAAIQAQTQTYLVEQRKMAEEGSIRAMILDEMLAERERNGISTATLTPQQQAFIDKIAKRDNPFIINMTMASGGTPADNEKAEEPAKERCFKKEMFDMAAQKAAIKRFAFMELWEEADQRIH